MSEEQLKWIDDRIREKDRLRESRNKALRNPSLPVIDATRFANQLSELAETLINKLEREGHFILPHSSISIDIAVTLRFLNETYKLVRFINGEETRFYNRAYRLTYSFVSLPLVRTMIDGFSNCARLLEDPSTSKAFRVSGYFRLSQELRDDESAHGSDPTWRDYLAEKRNVYENGKRAEHINDIDLQDKANKWPLLREYLDKKPDSELKQLLRAFTIGIWKEYSSVSHASYDGLIALFGILANDRIPRGKRLVGTDAVERVMTLHIGRVAGLLLCLLTEIQSFYMFKGSRINERIHNLWQAMEKIPSVDELYEARYKLKLSRLAISTP